MKGLFKSKPKTPADLVRQTRDLLVYFDRNSDVRESKREEKSVNPNDFDDTQVVPPTSSSIDNPVVGTPSLLSRTITALWNAIGSLRSSRLGVGDLSPLYSSVLAVSTNYVMELFSGSELEGKVMERAGCIDYSRTNWEIKTTNVFQRQTFYKFDEPNSRYRREVITSQKKIYLTDRHGWFVEEIMTLRGVPQSDYFTVHLKYHIEDEMSLRVGCKVEVSFGLSWLKTTEYKARITRNIQAALQKRLRVLFDIMEKPSQLNKPESVSRPAELGSERD